MRRSHLICNLNGDSSGSRQSRLRVDFGSDNWTCFCSIVFVAVAAASKR